MLADKLRAASGVPLPIQYVGGYTQGFVGTINDVTVTFGGNLTGGIASSASEGDIVIVYFGTGSSGARDLVVSGYTEIAGLYSNDTFDTNLVVAYKVMGTTPDTTFVLTGGTGNTDDAGAVVVQVWRNVDPDLILASTATGVNSVLCDPPAVTPTVAGSYIVAGGAGAHSRGTFTYSSSDLTAFRSVGANDTNDVTVGVGYHEWVSGTFNPAAFTFGSNNSADFSWAAVTLILRPLYTGQRPRFVAQTTASSSATSLTVNRPTGTVEGDLMIAIMRATISVTWTGATGWTEVADEGSAPSLRIAYRVAGPSEGSSYTFTSTSGTGTRVGYILTYRGAAYDAIGAFRETTPITVTGPTASASASILLGAAVATSSSDTGLSVPSFTTVRVSGSTAVIVERYVEAGPTGTLSFGNTDTGSNSGIALTIKPA